MVDRRISYWAENGDRSDPGASQELAGYAANQKPPHEEFNFLIRQALRVFFDDMQDFVETSAVNEQGIILREIGWAVDDTSVTGVDVDTDGQYVFTLYLKTANYFLDCLDRRDGTEQWSVDLGTTQARAVCADGDGVYVAVGNTVQKRDRDAGALVTGWASSGSYDHGGVVHAIHSLGTFALGGLLIGGAAGTGSFTHRLLDTDGALLSSADHGGTIYACMADSEVFWVAGAPGTTNEVIRAYIRSTSFGTSSDYVNANITVNDLVVSESLLFAISTATATGGNLCNVRAFFKQKNIDDTAMGDGAGDSALMWSGRDTDAASDDGLAGAFDGRWVYVGTTNGIERYDAHTGARVPYDSGIGAGDGGVGLACDGPSLFVAVDDGATTRHTLRVAVRESLMVVRDNTVNSGNKTYTDLLVRFEDS